LILFRQRSQSFPGQSTIMAIQKKHAKARLDKYYYLAKEKGYRARAAFKLIQLNKKYSFLQNARCLIDLCAAPGSWLQVAAETMPAKSLIVGVDLSPIKPIPKTITFQGDITTDKTRAIIRGHLKTWKADCVIHDGAPNVGTAWVQDAFTQNELVLCSLKLATDFLAPNGTFVTKVFRSKDSAKLEWVFKQLFVKVEQTKPPSSRNVSAETFYVCRGYKAPKNLDPRFLDSKYAFAEVEEAAPNNEAKVFNPEKKKRKRDGYEEGDWTQFHEAPASEFIQTQDPIAMLGSLNRLHFRQETNGDIALAALDKLPETTEEVRLCCEDLKVLGRKEFKILLRWRLKAREIFGFRQKKTNAKPEDEAGATAQAGGAGEEVAVLEPMDEEMRLQEEIQALKDIQDKSKKKERRKNNEKKQKEIVRMQMGMTTPMEIGMEASEANAATFRLKDVDREDGIRRQLTKGRMHTQIEQEQAKDFDMGDEDDEEDEAADGLERQLDGLYEQYQERREARDTKARAKRVRRAANGGEEEEEEFEDFDERGKGNETDASEDADLVGDEEDDDDSEDDTDAPLTTDLRPKNEKVGGLTRRAASFFEQDIFQGIEGLDEDDEDDDEMDADLDEEAEYDGRHDIARDSGVDVNSVGSTSPEIKIAADDNDEDYESDDDIELDTSGRDAYNEDDDWTEGTVKPTDAPGERPNINIITAEAMTLAHALATGKVTKQSLADDSFNKFSLRDTDGLPEWFLDDEGKHSRPHKPVTAAAAAAIKEKLRALNARPIKKVREAKARKIMRTARRLEKLKKKSDGVMEDDDRSERDKANAVAELMAKAKKGGGKKNKRPSVKVVRAGGQNKGAGRPRGVKGKYKMVDSRLKKDVRGLKRAEKKAGRKLR
jgi:AdoMet-dependent rRNA methyltransferase SPB1